MAKKINVDKFPRTLYKKGGELKLYSAGKEYEYSSVIVEDEEDLKAASATGYTDDYGVVIAPEDVEEKSADSVSAKPEEKKGFLGLGKQKDIDDF